MSDSLDAQASGELENTALLHISAWDFGIMRGLLSYLQSHGLIDRYDLDEILRFQQATVPLQVGPDRYCLHYRIYDEPPLGKFTVEDRAVNTSYDYKHTVRAEALEAAATLASSA
jgi:hypothetical protein